MLYIARDECYNMPNGKQMMNAKHRKKAHNHANSAQWQHSKMVMLVRDVRHRNTCFKTKIRNAKRIEKKKPAQKQQQEKKSSKMDCSSKKVLLSTNYDIYT